MTPVGILLTFVFAAGVLFLPRRWAVLGCIAAVCYVTQYQNFVLVGFNFTTVRLVLLLGFLRTVLHGDLKKLECNRIDWAVFAYPIAVTVAFTLRIGTTQAFIYQLGCSYDIVLSYLVLRCLLGNMEDIQRFLGDLALFIVPLAVLMLIESVIQKNAFGVELPDTYIRGGRLRCTGSFRGPITAGVFGATLMPLFMGIYLTNYRRGAAVIGLLSTAMITYASNSSAPLMAFFVGLLSLALWPWRGHMKAVRRGIVVMLISWQVMMSVPVWYVFSKLGNLIGGDGWHRSYLLDQAIRHFWDWWLLGMSGTGIWMPTKMPNGEADITNQYVLSGVNGGITALVLFVLIIVRCFQNIGKGLQAARSTSSAAEKLLWCFGVALFAHVITIFTVEYFDQMRVAFYFELAMLSSASSAVLKSEGVKCSEEELFTVVS